MFDVYLFADYSGAGEHREPQGDIVLVKATTQQAPVQQRPAHGRAQNFSRDSLRAFLRHELDVANDQGLRVIFGFDHQYSWPPYLWTLAQLGNTPWRDAITQLWAGSPQINRPALDRPSRFCHQFNTFANQDVFWAPLPHIAAQYHIPQVAPNVAQDQLFRLTELAPNMENAKPANAVGGRGIGSVGGQTICGLYQIAEMLQWSDVAWWPFDGLSIGDQAYHGRHVGVEIYPSLYRPRHVPQTNFNDAYYSCLYVQNNDANNQLVNLMNLANIQPQNVIRILKKGWVIGADPARP